MNLGVHFTVVMPTKNEKSSRYTVTCSMRYLPRKPVAAPILCGLDLPISGILGDCRGEIAQDRDRHGFPTNSRVQQEFVHFNYTPVSASFSGAYQVQEGFLMEGSEMICSNFEKSLRLRRELVRTGSHFVDICSWA